MINLSLPYLSGRIDVAFLLTKQGIIHIKHWRYAFYLHVFLSIFTLTAGFTQFSGYVVRKYKKLHRAFGYLYVCDVLFLAGPSALIMGFYANGHAPAKLSFVLLAVLWMLFTFFALHQARQKQFTQHRNWMIRSYALTLSAISLRLLAYFLPKFLIMDGVTEYTLIAWLSWTVNLLIAEIIIYLNAKKDLIF